MKIFERFISSSFYIKWTNWEYYPIYIINIPVVIIWLFYALKAKDLFFFSNVNPAIETGGVLGESKINILNRLPKDLVPKGIYVQLAKMDFNQVMVHFYNQGYCFPIIAKPDIGERGMKVEKLNSMDALKQYHENIKVDYIIQELIAFPMELSVLYYRKPNSTSGKITSVCIKEPLTVVGNGVDNVEALIMEKPRARLQLKRLKAKSNIPFHKILKMEESLVLETIGNHSRGTKFLNGNKYIDQALTNVFDDISNSVEDMYYGRYDLKCESIERLKEGKCFKLLEYNGVASEPAHIYDPEFSWIKAYGEFQKHWKIIYQISKIQKSRSVPTMTFKDAMCAIKAHRKNLKLMTN